MEGDHVHLLVNYPPKVSISKLVNSLVFLAEFLEGTLRKRAVVCYTRECFGPLVTLLAAAVDHL